MKLHIIFSLSDHIAPPHRLTFQLKTWLIPFSSFISPNPHLNMLFWTHTVLVFCTSAHILMSWAILSPSAQHVAINSWPDSTLEWQWLHHLPLFYYTIDFLLWSFWRHKTLLHTTWFIAFARHESSLETIIFSELPSLRHLVGPIRALTCTKTCIWATYFHLHLIVSK